MDNIIEGNKAIAVFDGMKIGKLSGWMSGNVGEKAYRKTNDEITDVFSFEMLKYHTSWEWLTPVVEKVNKLGGYDVIIWKNDCHINDDTQIVFEHGRRKGEELISVVWRTVIDFLKWYNKPKQ